MRLNLILAGSLSAALFSGLGWRTLEQSSSACDLSGYAAAAGFAAVNDAGGLTVTWDGSSRDEVRVRLAIVQGTPTMRDIGVRRKSGAWTTLASNVMPEYRIVSGVRRMSNQQIQPLRGLNVPITPEIINQDKWDAFWDAPLDLGEPGRGGNPPPAAGIAGQPGLPRKPEEITRATATFQVERCAVRTNGARIEVSFPGVRLGDFSGRLQYTFYKGTNLIRQEVIASTDKPSVAYKYDAGLAGIAIEPSSRVRWRDTANVWQSYQFGGATNQREVPLKASNRVAFAEFGRLGSIATFPPPHSFFWAREIDTNLGYDWYRKDGDTHFSFGIRQAEREETAQYQANFALYSARPGTSQRMPVYFYVSADTTEASLAAILAFTHGDRYAPLAGYQVMNHHYHMDLGQRLLQAGSLDAEIPDLEALKALGFNIVSQIDSVGTEGGGPSRRDQLPITAASIEGARRHSDKDFLVMPNQEFYGSPLGGHTDLLFSHPVYWTQGRADGQPLVTNDAKYGPVYHVSSADDLMTMVNRERAMISMPHPRTKGSTGFPDAVKDTPAFRDPRYQGVGFRWGMGLDGSEQRLCEYRCLPLLDDMSNWVADLPIPPKYLLSISEARYQSPGDDIYASAPVSYVRLGVLPSGPDFSPIVDTLMRGDYFVTSGEVLISSFAVQGAGAQRMIAADVQWTFPLEFVEMVWGDGRTTDRKIVPATDLLPFGSHHFQIPFNAAGQKWVRFAAWDSAGNGALGQPVKLGR
jgi:hypothetical protein